MARVDRVNGSVAVGRPGTMRGGHSPPYALRQPHAEREGS